MILNLSVGDEAGGRYKKRRKYWWESVCPAANSVWVHIFLWVCICKCVSKWMRWKQSLQQLLLFCLCLLKIKYPIIALNPSNDILFSVQPKMNKSCPRDEAHSAPWRGTCWKPGPSSCLLWHLFSLLHSSPGPPPAAADVATTLYWVLLSHDNCDRNRVTPDNLGIIDTRHAHTLPRGQTWRVTTVSSF